MAKTASLFRDMRRMTREEAERIAKSVKEDEALFFTAPETQEYATALVAAMTGRYGKDKLRVRIGYDPQSKDAGWTIPSEIYVNAGNDMIRGFVTLPDKIDATHGVIYHEVSHQCYLDFTAAEAAAKAIENGKLYGKIPEVQPGTEEEAYLTSLLSYIKEPRFAGLFQMLVHTLDNCISDQNNEEQLIRDYHGYPEHCIRKMRAQTEMSMRPFEDYRKALDNGRLPLPIVIMDMALELARFGRISALDETEAMKDPLYAAMIRLKPDYDRAVKSTDSADMYAAINKTLLGIWKLLLDEIEKQQQQEQEQEQEQQSQDGQPQQGGSSGGSQRQSQSQSDGQQGDQSGDSGQEGNGDSQSQSDGQQGVQSGDSGQEGNGDSQSQSDNQQTGGDNSADGNGDAQNGGNKSDAAKKLEEIKNALDHLSNAEIADMLKSIKETADSLGSATPEAPATGAQKAKPQPQAKDQSTNEPISDTEAQALAESIMNRLASAIAEAKAEEAAMAKANNELMVLARGAGLSSSHKDIPLTVRRVMHMENEYEWISASQRSAKKALVRQVQNIFKDMQAGDTKRHQIVGRNFRASDAYRLDTLCFETKKQRTNKPDIAIAILVDQSGSMQCERIEQAQLASVLCYDLCREFEIPCLVCGHNTNGAGVRFNIYSDFRAVKGDEERVATGVSHRNCGGCNRDGMALQVAMGMLEKRPEPVKLLMIISDGQPYHYNYDGEAAEEDVRETVKKYRRKGISTIAFAIGDDKDRVKNIYGESFVDITDISEMPKKLANIMKREIIRAYQ